MPAVIQPWLQLPHCLCCQQPLPSEGAVSVQPLPLLEAPDCCCWPQRPQVAAQ